MSSTNRGAQREDYDKYYTPEWLVDEGIKILKGHEWPTAEKVKILEPACGGGAIVKKLCEGFPDAAVEFFDIAPDEGSGVEQCDFFEVGGPKYDIIITNPPYKEAQRFVEHSMTLLNDRGLSVMLLRVNFFGGQKRSAWLEKNMPLEMHVTPRRPNFKGKGTDSTEYAWFVWRKGASPIFTRTYLLDTRTDRFRR